MNKNNKRKVVAICTSDWHLSHKPPVWRSNEPDWYAAMQRPLDEINNLVKKYKCKVFCAGDIFDKWNSPPELINWTMQHIPPDVYSIPGQHDIPNHNIREMKKSAYRTLCMGREIICNLHPETYDTFPFMIDDANVEIWAWPFGKQLKSIPVDNTFAIALVHDYAWIPGFSYPNAPKEKHLFMKSQHLINGKYYGYDVIVYGDNHKSFQTQIGKTTIFNCGTLMRRKSDEENYKPQVGLLYSDGSVEPHYLDISRDKHLAAEEAKPREQMEELDMDELADELRKLGSSALDFSDAVKQYCVSKGVKEPVQDIILKAMENK
jgi:DNA repair exonuclease SbcCD nuclease subunit